MASAAKPTTPCATVYSTTNKICPMSFLVSYSRFIEPLIINFWYPVCVCFFSLFQYKIHLCRFVAELIRIVAAA